MTLADLIDRYRFESQDNKEPYFCSDDVLTQYANEAEEEACKRASLLVDSSSAICTINTDESLVDIDRRIIAIRRVKIASSPYPLVPATVEELDNAAAGWEDETGTPVRYVIDYETDSIRLYPAQTSDEDITLTVVRLPMASMEDDSDEPEIRSEYHKSLVHWMLYRAYSVQDADFGDSGKANKHLALFEREYGSSASARNAQWQRETETQWPEPLA